MKLTSAQIERTLSQFEAQAIPESHPLLPRLNELFGDHTSFLDSNGLTSWSRPPIPLRENSSSEGFKCCRIGAMRPNPAWLLTNPSRLMPLSNLSPKH